MKRTAYLLLDDKENYAPRYVYENKDVAERLCMVMPYSVVEVAYDVPEADTWRDVELDADKLDYINCMGHKTDLRAIDLVARCKKLAGVDE